MNYYLSINDEEKGPYALSQIEAMWRSGHITADAFICEAGTSVWLSITEMQFSAPADELAKRVHRLEQKNRVLVWVLILAGLAALITRHGNHGATPGNAPELALRDQAGNVRWKVAIASDGTVSQSYFDANGRERLFMGLDNENATRLRLFDLDGNKRVSLYALANRNDAEAYEAGLSVLPLPKKDGTQNGGVEILSKKDLSAEVSVYSSQSRAYSAMIAAANGRTGTTWTDGSGNARISTFTDPDNNGMQLFFDRDGKTRISNATFANSSCRISLLDTTGRERLISSTLADGTTGQIVNDGRGQAEFSFLVDASGDVSHYMAESSGEKAWENARKIGEGVEMLRTGVHVLSDLFGNGGN